MKYISVVFISFLCFTNAVAHGDSTRIRVLKTNPLSLFDFDNSFNVAYEQFFRKDKSFQLEAGYGNTDFNLLMGQNNNELRGFHVIKARTEYRKYSSRSLSTLPEGSYIGVELFYKTVFKKEEINIGREPINGAPQYWEYVDGIVRKTVGGSHFKFGRQFYVLDSFVEKKRRLLMDVHIGLGFRVVDNRYNYQNKRSDDFLGRSPMRTFATFAPANQTTPYVSATIGFKLGYLL